MFIYILIAVGVLLAAFLLTAALKSPDFRVSRTLTIDAPASAIFPHVNDLHRWEAWSPYDKRDPSMKRIYEGAESGVGAKYTWDGNSQVGEGMSTIIESRPNELVKIDLEFRRPFAGTSVAQFQFEPASEQKTAVTWSLEGKHTFFPRAMGLIMSMDKMIGGDFEVGLNSLKSVVETKNAN
ncbi:MAG: SRPBCC family protein [Planctomycetaceae bacterium]